MGVFYDEDGSWTNEDPCLTRSHSEKKEWERLQQMGIKELWEESHFYLALQKLKEEKISSGYEILEFPVSQFL
ncbi:MAG: hypothetical protein ACPLSN_06630, partial [Dictyoglomus turgidum]